MHTFVFQLKHKVNSTSYFILVNVSSQPLPVKAILLSECLCVTIMSFCAQIIRATRTRRATRVSPSAVVTTCRSMEPVPEDVTTPRSADCRR